MRDALNDSHISPLAILFMGIFMVFALVFVSTQRMVGSAPVNVTAAAPVETRALRFQDRADGSIAILDAGAAEPFEIIAPQTNGFLRGTLRGMARARKLSHASAEPPFELTRWADGRLSLRDPETAREINLEPFGPTNTAVFKRLLTLKGHS